MSAVKREGKTHDAAVKPTQADEAAAPFHDPFMGWIPEGVVHGAASLLHWVDDDLAAHHAPATPAAAAAMAAPAAPAAPAVDPAKAGAQDKQAMEYAKQLAGMRDLSDVKATGGVNLYGAKGLGATEGHYEILNLLDRVDDPDVRHKMMADFQQLTGQSLEQYIQKTSWDGGRDRKEAMALISPEREAAERKIAAMSEDERRELKKQAYETVEKYVPITGKDGADDEGNARKIADAFANKTPEQIEAIRAMTRDATKGKYGAYELMDRSLSGGHEDEAVDALHGNAISVALDGLKNAEKDPKRMRELIDRLNPAQRMLVNNIAATTGLTSKLPPDERREIDQRLAGHAAQGDADRITDMLKDPSDGFDEDLFRARPQAQTNPLMGGFALDYSTANRRYDTRKAANIIHTLEAMSPEDIAAARKTYDPTAHGGKTWEQMIKSRFDSDDADGQRVAALLQGDRTGDKALELREGMRKHDQKKIEEALKNEDLASSDPKIHARGLAQQQALAARVQKMDEAPAWFSDGPPIAGRTLERQLDDSYADYVEGKPIEGQITVPTMGAMQDKWVHHDDRKDKAHDQRIADQELISGGKLTLETDMYRARKDDDKRAELLDEVKDNKELAEASEHYKEKYGKAMIGTPDLDDYAYLAQTRIADEMFHGKGMRDLKTVEAEIAAEKRDVNEQKIEDFRTQGVKSERTEAQLVRDQEVLRKKQHSDRLENVEQMRMGYGGGVGSQELYSLSVDSMKEKLPAVETSQDARNDIRSLDKVATANQKSAREEKIELAQSTAEKFLLIAKVASFFIPGGPVVTALFNAATSYAAIQMKESIAGVDYHSGADYADLGVNLAFDLGTPILTGELKLGKAAATEVKAGEKAIANEAKAGMKAAEASAGAHVAEEAHAGANVAEQATAAHVAEEAHAGARVAEEAHTEAKAAGDAATAAKAKKAADDAKAAEKAAEEAHKAAEARKMAGNAVAGAAKAEVSGHVKNQFVKNDDERQSEGSILWEGVKAAITAIVPEQARGRIEHYIGDASKVEQVIGTVLGRTVQGTSMLVINGVTPDTVIDAVHETGKSTHHAAAKTGTATDGDEHGGAHAKPHADHEPTSADKHHAAEAMPQHAAEVHQESKAEHPQPTPASHEEVVDPAHAADVHAVNENAKRAKSKGPVDVETARMLAAHAQRAGVDPATMPKAASPEEILRANGMTDREIALYEDTLNRDQQASQVGAAGDQPSHHHDVLGRKRDPASPAHIDAALKANAILYQDLVQGELAAKVIPSAQVGKYLSGEFKGIRGDIGLARNMEGMGAAERVRYLGLDYKDSPYVDVDPQTKVAKVKPDAERELFQIETHLTTKMEDASQVPMGPDLAAAALAKARDLAARKARGEPVEIPKLLELNEDGELKHVQVRTRKSDSDPSAGFGATASMGLRDGNNHQYFRHNQEVNLPGSQTLAPGAELTRIGPTGERQVVAVWNGTQFVVDPKLPPEDRARFEKMRDDATPPQPANP